MCLFFEKCWYVQPALKKENSLELETCLETVKEIPAVSVIHVVQNEEGGLV